VPTRNRWDLVQSRLIPSLQAQIYKNWRCVLIDDDSLPGGKYLYWTDRRITGVLSYPKVINYPNTAWGRWCAGPIQAMNYVRQFIKNEGWFIRVDDDDELTPDALEKLVNWTITSGAELVSARHEALGVPVTPYRLYNHVVGGIQTTLCKAYVARLPYNRDCWRKSWDCMNDVDWIVRAINAGVSTSYMPETVCIIRPRPGQTEVGWKAQQAQYPEGE
jgi:glycosyltransferase involved in cell wall biosynthesis